MKNKAASPATPRAVNSTALAPKSLYELVTLNSAEIEAPTELFQRKLNRRKVSRIAADFDELIANEPKVAAIGGHYYVFDGQHTIAARKKRNAGKNVDVLCKVYYGLTEKQAASLFAMQTGVSSKPTSGETLRARIYAGEPETMSFVYATKRGGCCPGLSDKVGDHQIVCLNTAYHEYVRVGEEHYVNALKLINFIWGGSPRSLMREVIGAMCRFEMLYAGEYDRRMLVEKLHRELSPDDLINASRTVDRGAYRGVNAALKLILDVYNKGEDSGQLSVRF